MNYSETDVEVIFDDYANYYNQSGSTIKAHISVLAEFSSIAQALEHHTDEMELSLGESFQMLHYTLELISKKFTQGDIKKINLEPILEKLDYLVKQKGTLIGSYLYNKISFEDITDLNNQIQDFIDSYVINPEDLKINLHISTIERTLSKIKQVITHEIALGLIKFKIIEEYYPSELPLYSQLTEYDKANLRLNGNQLGAPLREDVPQDEIEIIVTNLLEIHERGERVVFSSNGKKVMFQIVHEDGRYKGRANINQIFKYFEHAHPNLLVISDRQFKERIKKAVPEGMK